IAIHPMTKVTGVLAHLINCNCKLKIAITDPLTGDYDFLYFHIYILTLSGKWRNGSPISA
ncbi:MAG: hypothetical protein Q4B57_04460, partial [Eubacteriales bacterium]|nr:hypothetical protein [Eubacteriales bacterium]